MNIYKYVIIGLVPFILSCGGMNKNIRKSSKSAGENLAQNSGLVFEIHEAEEKLVPINDKMPDPHRYFVIIGSFRNPDNARKYQKQTLTKGFNSEILKNEAGLYRISVLSTDEIESARKEINNIRRSFPDYSDSWLLIQKK